MDLQHLNQELKIFKALKHNTKYQKFSKKYTKLPQSKYRSFMLRYLPKIKSAQEYIKSNFSYKIQYYAYKKNSKIHIVNLKFGPRRFMHLCGIAYYKTPTDLYNAFSKHHRGKHQYRGASDFWYDLLHRNLNYDLIFINQKFAKAKWKVIGDLPVLSKINKISITKGRRMIKLNYSKAIRTKRAILGLALGHKNTATYYPKSLLNIGMFQHPNEKTYLVIAILSRDFRIKTYQNIKVIDSLPNVPCQNIINEIKKYKL